MRLNRQLAARYLARTTIVVSALAVVFGAVGALKMRGQGQSIEESVAKLQAIGRALQIYRNEYGFLPPSQRNDYWDAGLPPSLAILSRPWHEDHRWYLPFEAFRVSRPHRSNNVNATCSHFMAIGYYSGEEMEFTRPYLKTRGEDFPILIDLNINPEDYGGTRHDVMGVVLRAGGRVDIIRFDPFDWAEMMSK